MVSGAGSEADNAALDRCARANLGPGVPPVDWLTFFAVAALLLGISAVPLIVGPPRRANGPTPSGQPPKRGAIQLPNQSRATR